MSVVTKIRRQGGAAIVTIPPSLLKQMEATVGDQLSLEVKNGELIARRERSNGHRFTLKELLRGADALRDLNTEVVDAQDGDPIGNEIS